MKLEEILKSQGLTEEQVKTVVGEMKQNKIYISGEENLDIRFGKLKTDHDTLVGQHKEAQALIDQLKKGTTNNDDLQGKITEYETQVATLQQENEQLKVDSAIKVALLSEKAVDVEYLTFKLKEKNDLQVDEKGNIKGVDGLISELKSQYPNQFESTATGGKIEERKLDKTDEDHDTMTRAEFLKKPYNERAQFAEENPEAFATLMND